METTKSIYSADHDLATFTNDELVAVVRMIEPMRAPTDHEVGVLAAVRVEVTRRLGIVRSSPLTGLL